MGQHGLINWADDDKECYDLTLRLIEKAAQLHRSQRQGRRRRSAAQKYEALDDATRDELLFELLPWLRGQMSTTEAVHRHGAVTMRQFCASSTATMRRAWRSWALPARTISCARKSSRSMSDWNPQTEDLAALKEKLTAGLEQYRKDYAAYYEACKHPNSPAMRDPNPTVILIPGIGMIAWGKDKSESRVTAEFYNCAVEVMRGAEAIDEYIALPQQEAFDIEYWLLEEAKLQRMPRGKGTGAQRRGRGRRGQRHRQGGGASRWRRKARTWFARTSMDRPPRKPRRSELTQNLRARHRRRRHGHFRLRPGDRRWRWTSPIAPASARC